MGPQLLGAREMSVWSLWGMKQIKRYACTWDWTSMYWILAVPQCFFWQFHGLYSKENPCSGWICQRWFLGYTKEYGHNAMVILEDHVMVLHSGSQFWMGSPTSIFIHSAIWAGPACHGAGNLLCLVLNGSVDLGQMAIQIQGWVRFDHW
jgi:hypothetical protein